MATQVIPSSALADTNKDGAFKRLDSVWRDQVTPDGRFKPEANRYHLYVSLACPWACRTVAGLYLKGLDHVIGLSVVHPTWQRTKPDDPEDLHAGWVFKSPEDPPISSPSGMGSFPGYDSIPDTVNGVKTVRDLYELAGQKGGRYTVPVLWDKQEKTIVNNESSEILRMFNSAFNHLAKNPDLDLYPEDLRPQIDELNAWIYTQINNGVYRCGFAQKQGAYEEAFKDVFDGLDRLEGILSKTRYLTGDKLTEADIRLYVTLIRFDPVYVVYFKTNKAFIRDYPSIKRYVQDLYNTPGIKESTNMYHIKTHYFTSHPNLNYFAIVPVGGDPWWEEKPTSLPVSVKETASALA